MKKCPDASYSLMHEKLPLLGAEAKKSNIYGAGHYLTNIQNLEKNPPCNAKDNTARRTHRH